MSHQSSATRVRLTDCDSCGDATAVEARVQAFCWLLPDYKWATHVHIASEGLKITACAVPGDLVQTTAGKWITHPPTRCPNGHTLGPGEVPRRPSSLPRAWRRTHHMDLPPMRPDGVRATPQHPLHMPRRASDGAHLHRIRLKVSLRSAPSLRTSAGGFLS